MFESYQHGTQLPEDMFDMLINSEAFMTVLYIVFYAVGQNLTLKVDHPYIVACVHFQGSTRASQIEPTAIYVEV